MRVIGFSLGPMLLLVALPLAAQGRPLPNEWFNGFLADPTRREFSVYRAFQPCPAQDQLNDAVVRQFLTATLPASHVLAAAQGFAVGVEVCGDRRALAWLLDRIEVEAVSSPRNAASMLEMLTQDRSPELKLTATRLLRGGVQDIRLQEAALQAVLRSTDARELTSLIVEIYPSGKLSHHLGAAVLRNLAARAGDAFMGDLANAISRNPEAVRTYPFVSAIYQIILPDNAPPLQGPGTIRVVRALITARGQHSEALDPATLDRINRLETRFQGRL